MVIARGSVMAHQQQSQESYAPSGPYRPLDKYENGAFVVLYFMLVVIILIMIYGIRAKNISVFKHVMLIVVAILTMSVGTYWLVYLSDKHYEKQCYATYGTQATWDGECKTTIIHK